MTVGVPCELQCGSQTQAWGLGSAVSDFLCPACGQYKVASTVMDHVLPKLDVAHKKLLPYLRPHVGQASDAGSCLTSPLNGSSMRAATSALQRP